MYAVTIPLTARAFLSGQLGFVRDRGWDVLLVSSPGADLDSTAAAQGVRIRALPMNRALTPLADVRALVTWIRLLRRERPLITNVSTPKAGLLGGVAAWLTRVPIRIYVLRGLRFEGVRGWHYALLYAMEWCACRAAHRVVCVSPSLQREAVRLHLVRAGRTVVIGSGSSNGVDVARFGQIPEPARLVRLRTDLGMPPDGVVIGFVGRWSPDKGIEDLLDAVETLLARDKDIRLLLVGDVDHADPLPAAVVARIVGDPRVVTAGQVNDTAPYYALMDVLALPTRREGLPNVALEAAASGVPVVSTTATGAVDAVRHGKTGMIVPVGNPAALAQALEQLVDNAELRVAMGRQGAAWVRASFDRPLIWQGLCDLYDELAADVATRRSYARQSR